MTKGGVATVIVSDMNRAIRFYTELLGLKLEQRFGNEWASIKAPSGLVIGLHPMSSKALQVEVAQFPSVSSSTSR